MSARTVEVSNVSNSATEQDIKEFFSFFGDIDHVEVKSADESSQVAYITFRDTQGAETVMLLSVGFQSVVITIAADYEPPATATLPPAHEESPPEEAPQSAVRKAKDAIASMLAKGYVLGKGTVSKVKSFDERHQITSTAVSKVASLDWRVELSSKMSASASAVNGKVREVDRQFQISGKTQSAFSVAERKVSGAGSAMLKNKYIFTGVSFASRAFNKAGPAATDLGSRPTQRL